MVGITTNGSQLKEGKNEQEKQQKFKDGVAEMDKQYNDLPKCFQERIDKFREQAVAIAIFFTSIKIK